MQQQIPCKGDIVFVESKSKGRFKGKKAEPGNEYYVANSWVNSYGSRKLALIDESGEEYFTTDKCASVRYRPQNYKDTPEAWINALNIWMEKTYVPLIVTTIPKWGGKAPAISVKKSAILVKAFGSSRSNNQFWLSKKWMHPDDWPDLDKLKPYETLSVRIPLWIAEKNGIM